MRPPRPRVNVALKLTSAPNIMVERLGSSNWGRWYRPGGLNACSFTGALGATQAMLSGEELRDPSGCGNVSPNCCLGLIASVRVEEELQLPTSGLLRSVPPS
jgi:hypothetical protein